MTFSINTQQKTKTNLNKDGFLAREKSVGTLVYFCFLDAFSTSKLYNIYFHHSKSILLKIELIMCPLGLGYNILFGAKLTRHFKVIQSI